ncbi:hypothetical protein [Nitratifractor sp.]|uniref:hypothetical protein n=1 Tax=Nitratifractor sp. TaxID=2268144 RepID=UPI0025EE87E3|nr:hypothetical protein [Nitratifractor sp.]
MRYDCSIPVMKVQDPAICKGFGALGKLLPNLAQSYEELRDFFENAILDVFPGLLEKEDPKLELLDCEYFRLSAEKNYLAFARRIFEGNGGHCYWVTDEFSKADMQRYLYQLKLMDRMDEMIYSRQFDLKEGHSLYRIDDVEILEFAIRNFLRELIGGALFFETRPLAIIYGYDLSLPVLTETMEDQAHYREIARSSGLFFR